MQCDRQLQPEAIGATRTITVSVTAPSCSRVALAPEELDDSGSLLPRQHSGSVRGACPTGWLGPETRRGQKGAIVPDRRYPASTAMPKTKGSR
jgi:hypothetical protein